MAENKTKPTGVSIDAFLDKVADEDQRQGRLHTDAAHARHHRRGGDHVGGPRSSEFGVYHYVYESGREGDMCLAGFSPRKGNTVIYGMGGLDESQLKKRRQIQGEQGVPLHQEARRR